MNAFDAIYQAAEIALILMSALGICVLICFASMIVEQNRINKGGR